MTDKKLTDNEIIKAMECCSKAEIYADCEKMKCPLFLGLSRGCKYVDKENQLYSDALDLFTGQQAETKRLRKEVNLVSIQFQDLQERYEEAQAKIDKLKECPKCVYEYDGEIMEYCVQGPCSNFKTVGQVKAEAYKECLAKVKNYIKTHCNPYGKPDFDYDTSIKILNFIDKLAKEMVGENNG